MGLGLKEEDLGFKERGWVGGRGLNLKDLVFRLKKGLYLALKNGV